MKTVVIPTRNDNYGMFLAERAIQCLNSMVEVFDEVIVVDWNSPHGVPLLEQIRDYIRPTGKIKNITVPKEFIFENDLSECQPCCEVLARNVGIRRSTNEWIVSSNIDIIATPFDESSLSEDILYTVPKYNVLENIHLIQLLSMETHQKINTLISNKHLFERMKTTEEVIPDDKFSLIVGCGDFQIAHRRLWDEIRGFEEFLCYRCFADTNVMVKAACCEDYKTSILDIDIFHLEHKNNPYFWKKDSSTRRNEKKDAFDTYSRTMNEESWGFSDVEFETSII